MYIELIRRKLIWAFILALVLSGCGGVQTFPYMAKAGETTAVASGWKHDFSREKITVRIVPSIGDEIIIPAGDPSIRAVVNFYPDPLSNILVSNEVSTDLSPGALTFSQLVNENITNHDKDWWQTTVFIDLPNTLPVGSTSITITSESGETHTSNIEIISGAGVPEYFWAEINGPLQATQLQSLERTGHYVISLTSLVVPYGVELSFAHDPDKNNGGTGVAYVVNPRGDMKNIHWNDDGIKLDVLLIPSRLQGLSTVHDFKFYIAGGVQNLSVSNVLAVDVNGDEVAGVIVNIQKIN